MEVNVDFVKCAELGICESVVPKFFEIDDDGEFVLLLGNISDYELPSMATSTIAGRHCIDWVIDSSVRSQ